MRADPAAVPAGIWAVASGLAGPQEAAAWSAGARGAAAWTFRRPDCSADEALAALKQLAGAAPWLGVHGRGDWAAAAGADAVIAGRGSLPLEELGRLFARLARGCSVHDEQEQAAALAAGADFLVYGPVWDTPAKRGVLAPRGIENLRRACSRGVPVVAIGGILEPEQVGACRAAGARGAAVLRAARDPGRLAELAAAWEAG